MDRRANPSPAGAAQVVKGQAADALLLAAGGQRVIIELQSRPLPTPRGKGEAGPLAAARALAIAAEHSQLDRLLATA